MSVEKLSSDEVPHKFIEWLLNMGYPQEKVPSIDKVAQKCRGQYYMVWRSLMEHVQPKDIIKEKRLKVFCDDVRLCQKKNVFKERDPSVIIPEQLLLWRQQQELQKKVTSAESQVTQARHDLKQLMDKVSSRICQRDISRKKVEDKKRRVWLLRQVASELAIRKTNLEETRDIANSICACSDDDLQGKVDKCLALLRKQSSPFTSQSLLASNPVASSSVVSSQGDDNNIEDQLASLARSRGDALWSQLCERRTAVNAALAHANNLHSTTHTTKDRRCSTQSVLAHTASLHCTLALEAMKNRLHVKQTRARFAAQLEDLNDYVSGAACELLVLRCERASADARVRSLRTLLDELAANSGVFELARQHSEHANNKQIGVVDKAIENSRDELKRLVVSLATIERKIHSTKEVLATVFNSFQGETSIDRYKGVQLNFPQESVVTICQFFDQEREKRRNKADLSLDFDTPNCSFNNTNDLSNPRFIDELRIYLKKFELEKNRKLVMDSGEKIWIFETLEASLRKMYSNWLSNDVAPLFCPSISMSRTIQRIIADNQTRERLENAVKKLGCDNKLTLDLDVTEKKENEEAAVDIIKKRISENLISLQKSTKLLELGQKNLQFWQDDLVKSCISSNRTVNGKSYKEYEALYIEGVLLGA